MNTPKLALAGIIAMVLPLMTSSSHAGSGSQLASCTKNPNGSGICLGTFRDFRNGPNSSDGINFMQSENGNKTFQATWAGTTMGCLSNAATATMWPIAMTYTGYFLIQWDATGTCTTLFMNNASWARNTL